MDFGGLIRARRWQRLGCLTVESKFPKIWSRSWNELVMIKRRSVYRGQNLRGRGCRIQIHQPLCPRLWRSISPKHGCIRVGCYPFAKRMSLICKSLRYWKSLRLLSLTLRTFFLRKAHNLESSLKLELESIIVFWTNFSDSENEGKDKVKRLTVIIQKKREELWCCLYHIHKIWLLKYMDFNKLLDVKIWWVCFRVVAADMRSWWACWTIVLRSAAWYLWGEVSGKFYSMCESNDGD